MARTLELFRASISSDAQIVDGARTQLEEDP